MRDHTGHSQASENYSGRNLSVAFFLNLAFTIVEFIGGAVANSMAIFSDALHDLGDVFSLGMAWILERVSKKKRTQSFSYGYRRFSLLAALLNAAILIGGSAVIAAHAIPRVFDPGEPDAKGMLFFAIAGIVFNGAAALVLKRGRSLNERVASLHLLEDVLGWAAVLVGAGIMMFFDIPELDPVLSLFIAGYILYNAGKALTSALKLMLQAVPGEVEIREIERSLMEIEGVKSVRDTHIWSLDGRYNVLTVRLSLEEASVEKMMRIKSQARRVAREQNIQHTTIEIGFDEEDCEMNG